MIDARENGEVRPEPEDVGVKIVSGAKDKAIINEVICRVPRENKIRRRRRNNVLPFRRKNSTS